jgi:AcrR family transcriptional regulator
MLKGQDMLVLAALLGRQGPPATLAEIAAEVGISVSAVHRSIGELRGAQLVNESRVVQAAQVDEFLTHSLRYLFPPRLGGETRGIPTAWAAAPLRDQLAVGADGFPPVWPHPRGEMRGIEFEPLHPSVPEAALRDRKLGERLALFDALRLNDARIRVLARRELQERLGAPSAA